MNDFMCLYCTVTNLAPHTHTHHNYSNYVNYDLICNCNVQICTVFNISFYNYQGVVSL